MQTMEHFSCQLELPHATPFTLTLTQGSVHVGDGSCTVVEVFSVVCSGNEEEPPESPLSITAQHEQNLFSGIQSGFQFLAFQSVC